MRPGRTPSSRDGVWGLTLPRKSFLPTRSQSHTSTQSFSSLGSASSNSKVSFQRG